MKKHIRIISIFLVLVFNVSLILPSTTTFAADLPTIFVNEMFDDEITNSIPMNFKIDKGTDGRVVLRDEKNLNKAAYAKTLASPVSMSVPVSGLPDKYVVSADIMIGNARAAGNILSVKGSQTVPLLKSGINGEITLDNGYRVGGYRLGAWATYTFVINRIKQKYDFYLNGKKVVSDFYFSTNITAENAIGFDITKPAGESAGLYVDNVRVYSGDKVMNESFFPKADKNPSDIPYEETDTIEIGNKIILNSDGEEGVAPYFVPKSGVAEFAPLPGEEKSRIHFARNNGPATDVYADITLVGTEDLIQYVFSVDVYPAKFANSYMQTSLTRGTGLDIQLLGNGDIRHNNQILMNIPMKKWSTVTVVVKTDMQTVDAYLNGELVAENVPSNASVPSQMRIGFVNESYEGEVYFDRYQLYEGSEPRDISQEVDPQLSSYTWAGYDKDAVDDVVRNGSVFMTDKDVLYYNETKSSYTAIGSSKIYKDGVLYVDTNAIAEVLGADAEFDSQTGEIKIGDAVATADKASITSGGKETPISNAPFISDGKAYVPLCDTAETALGLHTYTDDRGWIYVGKVDWRFSNDITQYTEDTDIIDRYIQFERPSPDKIYEDLVAKSYRQHPRLFATPESVAELRENIKSNATMEKWSRNVISSANSLLTRDPVEYNIPDGLRLFLSCQEVRERLYTYSVAYLISEDAKYVQGAWKEIENACNWKDWNVTRHYLDSGEIGPGMAVAYDVFYNAFTDEQKAFMREKITKHYLEYAAAIYAGRTSSNMHTNTSNWGSVCNGSMLMWCLATMDDEEPDSDYTVLTKHLAAYALRGLEAPVAKLFPSGAWDEGPSYFQYVLEYTSWSIQSLMNSCGSDYGIMEYPGFLECINYVLYMQTGNGYFNFGSSGDGGSKASLNAPEMFLLARLTNNKELNDVWYNMSFNIIQRPLKTLDILFYTPSSAAGSNTKINYPLDHDFRGLEMMIMKQDWNSTTDAAAAMTAGTLKTNSQRDLGTFNFEALGERWAVDLGKANQIEGYLTTIGWKQYRKRAEGHNLVVINPDEGPGQENETTGYIKSKLSKPKGAYVVYDLSAPYSQNTSEFIRGMYFGDDRNTLVVQDEFKLLKNNSEIYWFMHTNANIEISADGKSALLTQNGKQVRVEFATNVADWKLEVREAEALPTSPWVDGQKDNSAFKKLTLVGKGSRDIYITAKLIPIEERVTYPSVQYIPISQWTIPDGEVEPLMNLTGIQVDGQAIQGFNVLKTEYNYTTIDTSRIPVVTATANKGTVSVTQAPSLGNYAFITLTDGVETLNYRVLIEEGIIDSLVQSDQSYKTPEGGTVTSEIAGSEMTVGTPAGMKRLTIAGFYTGDAQSGNPGEQMFDKNLASKWASDVEGVNVIADLGAVKPVNGIALSFTSGDTRNYKFDILVSEDNVNYKLVYSGYSTGKTAEYEYINFNANARYVKFIGYGHKSGEWNNINEFAPYVIE